ncbi:glycoside hydrolase family 2 protein [Paenibacillus aestuarii]|uniref:Beta-glucuronidase n=1 Tax=Paenibacillus aestuarii TaxID=516965 RepID=A0ABW0K9Q1_9BACL|nr:glycoside hydrolase family 2 TIM barrel-domain containing protein [Paenibacillus aestuarii]
MIRTFHEHLIRKTSLLDGLWDFVTDSDNKGVQEQWHLRFPAPERQLVVPSCWNNEMGLFQYLGAAWYRTYFHTNGDSTHVRLTCHGVMHHGDVYVDGQHLGYHFGGFTPFSYVIPELPAGQHELIIRVDNTVDWQTLPTDIADWFSYGGIYRSVELQELSDVYIDRIKMDYTLAGENADVSVQVKLRSLSQKAISTPVAVQVNGQAFGAAEALVPAGETVTLTLKETLRQVKRWQIGNAALYTFSVNTPNDDQIDRIGFRTVESRGGQVLVNGEAVYFQGVNRHEEHPEWGFAMPPKLMLKDLDILADLGCNMVRGSHYPQSKYWVDLLDERGLAFWEEIPMWGYFMSRETLASPLFRERGLRMIEEMIERDYHNPSILFWGAHNEIDTRTEEAYSLTEAFVEKIRNLDASRLVIYATAYPEEDIVLPFFDVIGINKYYGWYQGSTEGFRTMLDDFHKHAETLRAGDRPVLMSEFGAAGIYGDTGWEPRLFSEDYQAEVLETALSIFRDDPKIVGTLIWQFSDIRVDLRSDRNYFRDRARSFNNKGLVNEYRKPKQAYRAVRSIYRSGK